MALETKDTIFPGFGEELDIRGSVPVIYDPAVTGFRAAVTTDYLITINSISGNFNLFTGSTSVSNFPSNQPITGTVFVNNFPTLQAISGIVTAPVAQFNPTINTVTGAGSVSGQHFVEFVFSSSFSGTIQSSLFLGSTKAGYIFPLLPSNSTYGTISYNIPSGSAQLISF